MPGNCRNNGNAEINGLKAGIRNLALKVPDSFLSIQSPAQAAAMQTVKAGGAGEC